MARIVVLTEGRSDPLSAKTAVNLIRYRPDEMAAILDSTSHGMTSQQLFAVGGDLPVISELAEAPDADTLVIGIAPAGGKVPRTWRPILLDAIGRGMTIVSGLHDFLGDDAELAAAAQRAGTRLVDVRKNNERSVARQLGIRDDCLRVLTVGNDCSVGKMVAAVEVARGLLRAGHDAKFVATGQTGIMIEGDGCPIDCVVADFVNGAAERLVLGNQHHDILLIEGQGSLFHPSFSSVALGLLHGCLPDGMILCYEAGRTTARGVDHVSVPSVEKTKRIYETMASVMHPGRVIGVAVNGRRLSDSELSHECRRVQDELRVPACDVMRSGCGELVDAVLALKKELGK